MGYLIHPTCQIPTLASIYEQVFGENFKGTFVEVGAFDGMTYSNTWGLAEQGWAGLYIEPHPDFAKQCATIHSKNNVIVENCACGSYMGTADLIIYGEVSTMNLSKWNRDWGMNENTPTMKVYVQTLDYLLSVHGLKSFDLLVIDVEEMEIEVLKGFTVSNYLPKMIIVELHEGQGTGPDQKGWQTPWVDNYLNAYKKIYSDNINSIYQLR